MIAIFLIVSTIAIPLVFVLMTIIFYLYGAKKIWFEKGIRTYELNIDERKIRRLNRDNDEIAFFDDMHGFNWHSLYEILSYFTLKNRALIGFFHQIPITRLPEYQIAFEMPVVEHALTPYHFIFSLIKVDNSRYFLTINWKSTWIEQQQTNSVRWNEIRLLNYEKLATIVTHHVGYIAFNLRNSQIDVPTILRRFNSFYHHHANSFVREGIFVLTFYGSSKTNVIKRLREFASIMEKNLFEQWLRDYFYGSCSLYFNQSFSIENQNKAWSLILYYISLSIQYSEPLIRLNHQKFRPKQFEQFNKVLMNLRHKIATQDLRWKSLPIRDYPDEKVFGYYVRTDFDGVSDEEMVLVKDNWALQNMVHNAFIPYVCANLTTKAFVDVSANWIIDHAHEMQNLNITYVITIKQDFELFDLQRCVESLHKKGFRFGLKIHHFTNLVATLISSLKLKYIVYSSKHFSGPSWISESFYVEAINIARIANLKNIRIIYEYMPLKSSVSLDFTKQIGFKYYI